MPSQRTVFGNQILVALFIQLRETEFHVRAKG